MTVSEWTTLSMLLLSIMGMLITAGWVSAWWLSKRFGGLTRQIDDQIDKLEQNLVRKMEYHERHDDDRFSQVRNDIWELRLQNASKEGKVRVIPRTNTNPVI